MTNKFDQVNRGQDMWNPPVTFSDVDKLRIAIDRGDSAKVAELALTIQRRIAIEETLRSDPRKTPTGLVYNNFVSKNPRQLELERQVLERAKKYLEP